MTPSSRDRISVDLCGLKASLFEQARARGVSPSGLVRDALIDALGRVEPSSSDHVAAGAPLPMADRVRLSLRMSREEASATLAAARQAGLAPGAFVAGLVAGVPALLGGASRDAHIAALIASSAELSTLSRDIHHLTSLLRQGNPPYSVGQESENDGEKNLAYPQLDARIASTYAAKSTAGLKRNLYDSYSSSPTRCFASPTSRWFWKRLNS